MQLQKREKDLMNLINMMYKNGEIYYETRNIRRSSFFKDRY